MYSMCATSEDSQRRVVCNWSLLDERCDVLLKGFRMRKLKVSLQVEIKNVLSESKDTRVEHLVGS